MRNEEWLTGGTFGINNIARPSLLGLSLDGNLAYYYFVLGTTVLLAALLWGLLRSPWGKAFTALRDNPIRAESLGVHIQAYTLLSFAIGAVYAGIAGALFASLVRVHRAGAVHGRRVDHDVPDGRASADRATSSARCSAPPSACCCPSGCASRRPGTCSCSASPWSC